MNDKQVQLVLSIHPTEQRMLATAYGKPFTIAYCWTNTADLEKAMKFLEENHPVEMWRVH